MSNANVAVGKKSKGAGCLRWLGRIALGVLVLVLVLITTGAIYQAVASARDAKTYKPVNQMVDVNGIQMRLDCRGSGSPTVVLEAGAQSWSTYWALVQDDVAKFTRVCSYDRAGYGWSEPVHETLLPPKVAEMLHDLLKKGGEEPPYLMVGHSFGGVYIRVFTENYRDEVVGMVLVDSSHENQAQEVPPEFAQSPIFAQLQKALSLNLQIFQIAEPIGLLRAFKLLDANASLFPEEDKKPMLAETYRSGYSGAYARETEMISTYSGEPRKLGDIPLIVFSLKIDGQKLYDRYPPSIQAQLTIEMMQQQSDIYNEQQNELAALSTRSKHVIVEDSGHFIQLEVPQVVTDAIREVFEQVAK